MGLSSLPVVPTVVLVMTDDVWGDEVTLTMQHEFVRSERTAADFEYPYATGARVPTASRDGLCVLCDCAWPCTRCPDLVQAITR